MEMTKQKKIIGTIELVAAAVVLVAAVVFAPAYQKAMEAPTTEPPVSETNTAAQSEAQTQTTAVTEATTAPPEVGEYSVKNYIVVTSDSAMEMYSIAKKSLGNYAQTVNTLAGKVPGTKVYVMLAPTRIAFYGPEEYRTGSHDQAAGMQIVYDALDDGTVISIDAYSELSRHTDDYIYFRTDHHWTARGAYYAYKAFCATAGLTCKPLADHKTDRLDGFVGSMYRYTQSESLKKNPDYVEVFYPTVEASGQYFSDQTMSDGKTLKIISVNITSESSKYMAFIQGDKPLIKMTTNVGNGQKILLIKESYGNAFAPFLLENYSEVYVLDPRQDSIQDMNLAQFIRDNGIQNVLFLNYMMAPSNSTYMDSLNAMVNR